MARADSVTNALGSQCRHLAELFAELSYNRGSCGRDEFVRLLALAQRNAAQNLERRRGWNRKTSMLAFDPTAPFLEFGNVDRFNA